MDEMDGPNISRHDDRCRLPLAIYRETSANADRWILSLTGSIFEETTPRIITTPVSMQRRSSCLDTSTSWPPPTMAVQRLVGFPVAAPWMP